jgi:hypothetical protein
MLLNLRGHDLLLQIREQRFAFCRSQPTVAGEISSARSMIPGSCSTGLPGSASRESVSAPSIASDNNFHFGDGTASRKMAANKRTIQMSKRLHDLPELSVKG